MTLDQSLPPQAPAPSRKLRLRVEGWRGINHSFALVNQFQLLELIKRPDVELQHLDAPFFFAHWNKAQNGAGFHPEDEAALAAIPGVTDDFEPDWTYRIFSPPDLSPPVSGRLAVFAVTELGYEPGAFGPDSTVKAFEDAGHILITPSTWSRDRLLDYGFKPETIHIVPHGASPDYFSPMPPALIQSQRDALGIQPEEIILLNIGAPIWNKGIDILLRGFALARKNNSKLRLLFKDQRNTYGVSAENFVRSALSDAGLLDSEVLAAITLIPANLTMDQMNSIYGIADCYVSPYRAEGYNLPVLEAMVCGTASIVTRGGATSDFRIPTATSGDIQSELRLNTTVQGRFISAYLEPDLDGLVALLNRAVVKSTVGLHELPSYGTWRQPIEKLLSLFAAHI